MIRVIFLTVGIILIGGCGSTLHKSFDGMHQAGLKAHTVLKADFCRPAMEQCKEARRENPQDGCPELTKCQVGRQAALKAVQSLQTSVVLGLLSLEVADKPSAEGALQAAVKALLVVRANLKAWGVNL